VWATDRDLSVFDLLRNHCRTLLVADNNLRKKMLNAGTIAATERLIKSDRRHAATVEQWDSNDWILNTPSGIVDLNTGNLLPHEPNQHCTKITAAGPDGDCPIFQQFLNDVTNGDHELINFIQRVMGYACTGSTREHALFFFYGTGANGKGTLLNTITSILSDYAVIASTDVFTESRHDRHPTELAALMGARLVVAQETDEGRKWAESKIKALTGGDPITARFMRQDFFTYLPKFTLIIAGNHKPSIQTVDEAMRRRLNLVPFTVTIPKEQRDPDLAEKLQRESAGIMQWLIDGALAYQEQGLNPPQAVLEATESYFEDEDTLAQWIAECCETVTEYWDKPTLLFNSWKDFAVAANFMPGSNKEFKSKMEATGYRYHKTGPRGRHYEGIRLNASNSAEKWGAS
jgi:putative DNA primase/helicase